MCIHMNTCVYRVFRWLGPFPTSFGLGPGKKRRRTSGQNRANPRSKNNALVKMANFGPFFGPWMAIPCTEQCSQFPVIFCIFSLRCDHDLSLFYCPYLFTFVIFYYRKSTTQHTTWSLTDTHGHSHTHAHLPLTLESGLS